MLKCTPEELEKRINALEGICKDGKQSIKELFSEAFGVKFKNTNKKHPKVGEVWFDNCYNCAVLMTSVFTNENDGDATNAVSLTTTENGIGHCYWANQNLAAVQNSNLDCRFPYKLADSPEDFFNKTKKSRWLLSDTPS